MRYVWQGVIIAISLQIHDVKIVANLHYVCQGMKIDLQTPKDSFKRQPSLSSWRSCIFQEQTTWKMGFKVETQISDCLY